LDRFRIPEAVTGGLLTAVAVTALRNWGSISISFTAGDLAMLTFFSTIG
jgi:sodium--glutamate symport carrier gltS